MKSCRKISLEFLSCQNSHGGGQGHKLKLTQVFVKVLNLNVLSSPIPSEVRVQRPPVEPSSGLNAVCSADSSAPFENIGAMTDE